MNSTKEAARTAGVLYFLSSLPAPFSLLYIPSVFMVMGDATATANKIRTSPLLFRVGIVAELISATTFIFMGLAFYHLLKGVNKKHALLMLTLVLISVPISFLNELNRVAALMLSNGAHIAGRGTVEAAVCGAAGEESGQLPARRSADRRCACTPSLAGPNRCAAGAAGRSAPVDERRTGRPSDVDGRKNG